MNKTLKTLFLMFLCMGFLVLLIPSSVFAFEAMPVGEEGEFSFHGYIREYLGMFTEEQAYAENGNKLATARTMLRLYENFKINDTFRIWAVEQFAVEPRYPMEQGAKSSRTYNYSREPALKGGKEYSDYKDIDDILREFFVEWNGYGSNIKIGRQIAIWGEAMTGSVNDIIHPSEGRWAFFYGNADETRIPQWMIRGTHSISPLNSVFEWIINPLLTEKEYRVKRTGTGVQGTGPFTPGQRWTMYPEDRTAPATTSHYTEIPTVTKDYPDAWRNLRGGFRTVTTIPTAQFGVVYWHGQDYDPRAKWGKVNALIPIGGGRFLLRRDMKLFYPTIDWFGAYGNMQLVGFPGTVRTEMGWCPNWTYFSFDKFEHSPFSSGLVHRNYFKYMIGYDFSRYFTWHPTAPIAVTIEHIGEYIPHAGRLQWTTYNENSHIPEYNGTLSSRVSTDWLYGKFSTSLTAAVMRFGRCGFIQPAVKYVPGLFNKNLSFNVSYIRVYGKNDYDGYFGANRTKDNIVLMTEFAF